MSRYLGRLSEINSTDVATFGRKTVNAALLLKRGYEVPPGFGMSLACFALFCDHNQIDVHDPVNLQHRIMAGHFPDALRSELETMWRFSGESVERHSIVRSSAVEEDGNGASYAGVYESVMNIRRYDDLERGIRRCWSSCYSDRARAYRGVSLDGPSSIGLLIQEMIDGTQSGVLFTVDPVLLSGDQLVIEAYPGLNFALVEGTVPADRYVVDRHGRITDRTIRTKQVQYGLGEQSFEIETLGVLPERWNCSTLSDEEIASLAEIGLKLEYDLKHPCDVEWTIKEGKIYVLQVRPVSLPNPRSIARQSLYDSEIPAEVECSLLDRYSEPACACYLSLLERWEKEVYLDFYSKTEGRHYAEKPLLFFFNRVYWNLKYQRRFFDDLPFDESGPRAWARKWTLVHLMLTGYKNWYRRLPRYEEYIRHYSGFDLPSLKLTELCARLAEFVHLFCNFIGKDHFQFLGLAQVSYTLLTKKLASFGDPKEAVVDVLEEYASRNMTMRSNLELLDLATTGARDSEVARLFENHRADRIYALLGESDRTRAFRDGFDHFIAKHGHRGTSCDDLYSPHWEEDPVYVLEIIKQLISSRSEKLLHSASHERARGGSRRWKTFLEQLPYPGRSALARWHERYKITTLMTLAAEYMALRENQRYYFDKSWIILRKMILEVGRRLAGLGILEDRAEVFHLSFDEILAVCGQDQESGREYCRELVPYRMRVYEKNKKITPPYLIKDSDLIRLQKKGLKSSYKAVGLSPGKAAGSVRLLSSVYDLGKVQQGEIVVVSTFHPSWTPVLSIVSGMIMNYGNILSHGAVVAREYRIPVVVFNDMATQVFQDGQWIEIDGSTGRIRILDIGQSR